jgi:hypothetical protein
MHRDSPLFNSEDCSQGGQRGKGIPKLQNVLQSFSKQTADMMEIKYPMELEYTFFPVPKQITNASQVISSL